MPGASIDHLQGAQTAPGGETTPPLRRTRATGGRGAAGGSARRMTVPPITLAARGMPATALSATAAPSRAATADVAEYAATTPALTTVATQREPGMAAASVMPSMPGLASFPYSSPGTTVVADPEVWLVAMSTPAGGLRQMEGAGRVGAIRVSRPYGHLRSIRPVLPTGAFGAGTTGPMEGAPATAPSTGRPRRARVTGGSGPLADPETSRLPAMRPLPQVVSAVEVETDAGVFRVERPDSVLGHSDIAWAMAHLEAGEPDSVVPLPRRQLALLLTLLPTPQDPEHPELDPTWGWAHRLRGPWERGPLHTRGRLGRLIAIDADPTGKGQHRACFELLGSEDVVWALGVPCFRTGSVYELVPLAKGASRWLSWPLSKARSRAGSPERPTWEIARVVYRVGAPRWPLAGVVEPVGPLGVAG